MDLVKSANLLLRFLLELCALAALAYWGATAKAHIAARIALAIAVPLAAAVAWALIVAPNTPRQAGPIARIGVEVLVFVTAIAGLAARQRFVLALIFAVLYIINRTLMIIWHQ
jgi:Protein of unknown function (DUF2568)